MSLRVLSQKHFPGRGAGPYDDCWVVATYWALAQACPWLTPPGIDKFREAAGAPDSPLVANGGTEKEMFAGLAGTWPDVAAISTKMSGWTWRRFLDEAKANDRPAALIVLSDLLPRNYGFAGPNSWHAVGVMHRSGMDWFAANPLEDAHNWPDPVDQPTLRRAVEAYRGAVHGVLLPSIEEAFKLHPLYQAPGLPSTEVDRLVADARLAGRSEVRTAAESGLAVLETQIAALRTTIRT